MKNRIRFNTFYRGACIGVGGRGGAYNRMHFFIQVDGIMTGVAYEGQFTVRQPTNS